MHSFFSFLLVFFFAIPLVSLNSLFLGFEKTVSSSVSEISLIEEKHFIERTLRESAEQVLNYSNGETRQEKILTTSENLRRWGKFVEEHFKESDWEARAWIGSPQEEELKEIAKESLSSSPLRCASCFGLGDLAIGWDKKPVLASAGFLSMSGDKVVVSREGNSNLPGFYYKKAVLGITLRKKGFAFVAIAAGRD